MCGIVALVRRTDSSVSAETMLEMRELVAHRGPDGAGECFLSHKPSLALVDPHGPWQVALGHRRLAILDLEASGRQPMSYADGSLWVIHNGEIYNYLELRAELESQGYSFRSTSDTEVILAAYQEWGPQCFSRFRGMWAFVLVDGRRREIVWCRDRLGIKPLYRVQTGDYVAFFSEVKQAKPLPEFSFRVHREVFESYLATGHEIPGETFFEGVTAMEPGFWGRIDIDSLKTIEESAYWNPSLTEAIGGNEDDAASQFFSKFRESVALRLRSDVPVGIALSGGLDSSAVAYSVKGLRPKQGSHTFSALFPGESIDESAYIQTARRSLPGPHISVHPTAEDILKNLDQFIWYHDEPVGSLSQYAAFAVARATRESEVPVTLNGQGGDELFGGYWQSYLLYLSYLARHGAKVNLLKELLGTWMPGGNREIWFALPGLLRRYWDRTKVKREGGASHWEEMKILSPKERRLFEIRKFYLPRLLKWDDRNFMAFGVEGRYPFLDHELIELVLRFSDASLYQRGWTKVPLRESFAGVLPENIRRRRTKIGFETPESSWLRGALKKPISDFVQGDSPLWDWVPRSRVQESWRQHCNAPFKSPVLGQKILRYFMADRWLRIFIT